MLTELPYAVDASTAAAVLAASGEAWCWFDGAAPAPGESAVSLLGVAAEVRMPQPGAQHEFLAELRAESAAGAYWALALSYEFGVGLLGVPRAPGFSGDASFAIRLDAVLAIDHATGRATLRGSAPARTHWLARFDAPLRAAAAAAEPLTTPARTPRNLDLAWRRTDAQYEAEVEACRSAIAEGDAYVLCLTDTAETVVTERVDPLALFLQLRATGPAVRGGVIVAGDRALVSVSPERFLSVHDGTVRTHPIKGTRKRGTTEAADRALATELRTDPKERAENLMIVDLMRNDLSRVCTVGSVRVERFLEVETHPHVHQLVSTVAGDLAAGNDMWDALAACFPGGSMTGAPKRRAVEILGALEAGPRGLYSGCFGWVDENGDAEIAMTIRSVEIHSREGVGGAVETTVRIGAGGGITADSDPAMEAAEKHLKATPLLAAL
ncbi:anthranilate synthase component I family protein [Leucobacter sp. cx-42]|uniref:anthranilate synthase component I family protein n=1 Tax=unclassified Leucobacter TaxID=2621730 RepID=UPI00165EBB68|nr:MULTISPECIES: anthranilate synthase component I family protein [unclassified Leucobacter]MBC9954664.1 anthranilate synthase component I family protein [Leucobacter sp. cx-42]